MLYLRFCLGRIAVFAFAATMASSAMGFTLWGTFVLVTTLTTTMTAFSSTAAPALATSTGFLGIILRSVTQTFGDREFVNLTSDEFLNGCEA